MLKALSDSIGKLDALVVFGSVSIWWVGIFHGFTTVGTAIGNVGNANCAAVENAAESQYPNSS